MLSAYEHLVPEKLFTDTQHPGEAVSAVKALAIANAQGQKIYRITMANINAVLPQLAIDQDVKSEIQNAVAVGKEATVSQSNITVSGWTGVGYIIEDPATGSAAYKISGGANGGALILGLLALFAIIVGIYIASVAIIAGLVIYAIRLIMFYIAALTGQIANTLGLALAVLGLAGALGAFVASSPFWVVVATVGLIAAIYSYFAENIKGIYLRGVRYIAVNRFTAQS